MGWRHSELAEFGPEVVPLDRAEAQAAYIRANNLCSRTRYGLDEQKFAHIERLDVNDPGPSAEAWLSERVGDGELQIVFGRDEVFLVPAAMFHNHWRDMFCPSRDDVVIIPSVGEWVLFYCHEDEFEFSRV